MKIHYEIPKWNNIQFHDESSSQFRKKIYQYEIVQEIFHGSFQETFKASNLSSGKHVKCPKHMWLWCEIETD